MFKKFLVVFEDEYNNKYSYLTNQIGDTIKIVMSDFDITPVDDINFDKLNSDDPYDIGTFSVGFYDKYFTPVGEPDTHAGRVMVFDLGGE